MLEAHEPAANADPAPGHADVALSLSPLTRSPEPPAAGRPGHLVPRAPVARLLPPPRDAAPGRRARHPSHRAPRRPRRAAPLIPGATMTVLARTSSHPTLPVPHLGCAPTRCAPRCASRPTRPAGARTSTSTPTAATSAGSSPTSTTRPGCSRWLPGQGTDWHDHGGSGGAFVVLQGSLVERTALHGVVRGPRRIHRARRRPRVRPGLRAPRHERGRRPGRVRCTSTRHGWLVQHDYVAEDGILRPVATRRAGDDW